MSEELRFDLDDLEARYYCGLCAAPYRERPEACFSCEGREFLSREEAAAHEEREIEGDLGLARPLVVPDDEHEDALIRSALDEAGISYHRQEALSTYGLRVGPWGEVRYTVSPADYEAASALLDRLGTDLARSRAGDADAPATPELDFEALRLARRRRIARVFMVLSAVLTATYLPLIAGAKVGMVAVGLVLAFGILGCALWSRHNPVAGFGTGFALMLVLPLAALFLARSVLLPGLLPLAAAWFAARPGKASG